MRIDVGAVNLRSAARTTTVDGLNAVASVAGNRHRLATTKPAPQLATTRTKVSLPRTHSGLGSRYDVTDGIRSTAGRKH